MSFAPGGERRKRNKYGWGSTLVTTAFVAYGAYRLGSWIYDTYIDDEHDDDDDKDEEYIDEMAASHEHHEATTAKNRTRSPLQRRQRMKRCRQETIQALQGFLPTLSRIIEEQTSTYKETHALKKIRKERRKKQQAEKKQQFQSPLKPQQSSPTATASDKSPPGQSSPGSDDSSLSAVTPLKETGDDDKEKKNDDDDDDDDRAQEVELWNVIKVQSVTRVMATAYAHTVLFLVLTVQVHLLGAHLWKEQQQAGEFTATASGTEASRSADDDYSYQESHRYVLVHTYEYFFEHGLSLLIQTVERAVEQVLQDWNVLDAAFLHVSQEKFDEAMDKIRLAVEELNGSSSSNSGGSKEGGCGGMTRRRRSCPRNLLRFLMPPTATKQYEAPPDGTTDDEDDNNDSHKVAQAILDETWDLLESPVLKDAQQDCLNVTFDIMREESWGQIFQDTSSDETATQKTTTTRPLAHILTKLKNTSNSFYDANAMAGGGQDSSMPLFVNSYCQAMEQLPSVLEVGDVSFS